MWWIGLVFVCLKQERLVFLSGYDSFFRNQIWNIITKPAHIGKDTDPVWISPMSLGLYSFPWISFNKQALLFNGFYNVQRIFAISAKVQGKGEDGTNYMPMFGGIIAGVLIFAFVIIIVAMFVRYNYR